MGDYLSRSIQETHGDDFETIRRRISEELKEYPNFCGVDFVDVHANGVQISGKHKQIVGYYFSEMPTIKYDFSNADEAVNEFVSKWKDADNPDSVAEFQRFLDLGNRWGWD